MRRSVLVLGAGVPTCEQPSGPTDIRRRERGGNEAFIRTPGNAAPAPTRSARFDFLFCLAFLSGAEEEARYRFADNGRSEARRTVLTLGQRGSKAANERAAGRLDIWIAPAAPRSGADSK